MRDYVRQFSDLEGGLGGRVSVAGRFHLDLPLLLLLALLVLFGLPVLYSASGQDMAAVIRQLKYMALATTLMLVAAQVPLVRYRRWSPVLYLGGCGLLLAVMFAGVGAKGAQRWLEVGGVRFQPSELLKLIVPMTVAWYLAGRSLPPRPRDTVACLVLLAIPSILVLQQPDLGTALLIAASGVFVIFMGGVGWRFVAAALLLLLMSAWPMWAFVLEDYQRQRILTLLNPESDKLGAGWNIIQSKTAIGSGGWEGKGWTQGTQSQLDFLPESHTDFIIAVLAEEFGLRGVLILLFLYTAIVLRGLWIGLHAESSYGRVLAGSLTLTFFIYVFVNMGMVAGLLPVVGVPLPLVSAGGTSIVTLMAGFGLLMAISADHRVVGE